MVNIETVQFVFFVVLSSGTWIFLECLNLLGKTCDWYLSPCFTRACVILFVIWTCEDVHFWLQNISSRYKRTEKQCVSNASRPSLKPGHGGAKERYAGLKDTESQRGKTGGIILT